MPQLTKVKDKDSSDYKKILLKTRTIVISGAIDSKLAGRVLQDILILEHDNPKGKIILIINSPGGDVHSGFAIFDMLQFVASPVVTLVAGLAASMGSILSLAGNPGNKLATPNSKIMIHQPLLGNLYAPATDIEIQSQEILKTKQHIAELYAKVTRKKINRIMKDIDRDHWFSAEEALEYRLIDKIVSSRKELG